RAPGGRPSRAQGGDRQALADAPHAVALGGCRALRAQASRAVARALMDTVRIDRWLWAARFFKTRGRATDEVVAGHVHLNGARVKPAKEVRVGDELEIRIGPTQWVVVVAALSDK